jgi:hypothetical protein
MSQRIVDCAGTSEYSMRGLVVDALNALSFDWAADEISVCKFKLEGVSNWTLNILDVTYEALLISQFSSILFISIP